MKGSHRPLARYRKVSLLSIFLLFTTFVLVLLVALSLPIIKPVYLFEVHSTAPVRPQTQTILANELRFGVWGVCATSPSNPPTLTSNPGECFGPMLGYQIPDSIASEAGISPAILGAVEITLFVVLVLHPITAILTFCCLLFSFFLTSHAFSIFTLIITIVSAIVGSVALAIDLALILLAQNELNSIEGLQFEVLIGNAVWMIVASVACLWLAVIALSARACFCFGVRRHHHHHHDHHHRPDPERY